MSYILYFPNYEVPSNIKTKLNEQVIIINPMNLKHGIII